MPAPSELEPSMVSAADLSKLEEELLTVYTKARIGSGAYSGSSHVTNPSTSSLPDPHSFHARNNLPRPSSTTPSGRNTRVPRPLPPTPGTTSTPHTSASYSVRSVSNDSDRSRIVGPHTIDGGAGSGLPTPGYASGPVSAVDGQNTTYQTPWNPPYDSSVDETNRHSYLRDPPTSLPEYTRGDPTFLPVPPYPYAESGTSNENFTYTPELPTPETTHSLSAIDLTNSLLRPPRTYSDHLSTYVPSSNLPYDQISVSESQYSQPDSPPTARIPRTSADFPTTSDRNIRKTVNRASDSSSLAFTRTSSRRYRNLVGSSSNAGPSNAHLTRRPSAVLRDIMSDNRGLPQTAKSRSDQEEEANCVEYGGEDEETRFVNFALLSHLAVLLRDKVPRGTHVKGSVPYPRAFTGKDIVTTIHTLIKRELVWNHGGPANANDRRVALQVARSLQSQLLFYEVEWGARKLQDGVEDVYMLMDDQEGNSDAPPDREELPTSVVTVLTRCYSPMCDAEEVSCYSFSCPRRSSSLSSMLPKKDAPDEAKEWVPPREIFHTLSESERRRQSIIHKLIEKEEQYVHDLDIVETFFISPLRLANPPVVVLSEDMDQFIDNVFLNILELRECNRRLLENMYVRQREQAPVVQQIGDILLEAATEFRKTYPQYVGRNPIADKMLKDELERNAEFRLFIEKCSRRQSARPGENLRLDLRHFLNRPSEHMQKYPVLLEAILKETAESNPDVTYLREAIDALKNLQDAAQLQTFQAAMGKGITARWGWQNLVSPGLRRTFTEEECRRQSRIFELIKGEMAYVTDLESIDNIFIRPLQNADPPIIPHERLGNFMQEVFYNWVELHSHHRRLLDTLYEIQREEHPQIRSVTAPVYNSALNFHQSYMEYIPNYPIAQYRIEDEMKRNPIFKEFAETCVRHPDAHMLDMKAFVNRPILQLLRYDEQLRAILEEAPRGHEDLDTIPAVLEIIKALGRETEPGIQSAKQKVMLWSYNAGLVFKRGETVDLDLLNENRSLIHAGKLLRQPESGSEANAWKEILVLLFDNYLVMTTQEQHRNTTKYMVYRRPVPLDLLTLVNFTDPATPRSALFRHHRNERRAGSSTSSNSTSEDGESRSLYPFTIQHNARLGGPYTLYADSVQGRTEWKQKLEEAMGLRKVVQESNKVFEMETLSINTFSIQPAAAPNALPTWSEGGLITGKVTCSIPFNTPDGRSLVAIGCAEGVWIGFRHDSRSMRRVLHLPMVTQCTILDDFGLFLVLADKALLAYHIEALVPPTQHTTGTITTTLTSQAPQRLNGNKEVQFFSVGNVDGRTLVIYMRKRGTGSHFHALEPIVDKINERAKEPTGRFGLFRSHRLEWFKPYKEFTLAQESYDLIFLKAKIAVLCTKGFEIMDFNKLESVTIPSEHQRLAPLGKRLETCRPIGIFRAKEDEFLLCYAEFGIYVDKQGDPSRDACTIEWEGCAENVVFHAPYVLLFDPRFIEIRHAETSRLVQIFPGNDIRCVWNGRGLDPSNGLAPGDVSDDQMVQEARIHAVSNLIEPSVQPVGRPPKAVTQHVFELIPTIPLYLPGSLSSPSTQTFFPQRFSPPHSPQLRLN